MAGRGFVDWDYPDGAEYDDYPRLGVDGKKKILGLNAAALYGIEVPSELQVSGPTSRRARRRGLVPSQRARFTPNRSTQGR